jgi:hypothetical protein
LMIKPGRGRIPFFWLKTPRWPVVLRLTLLFSRCKPPLLKIPPPSLPAVLSLTSVSLSLVVASLPLRTTAAEVRGVVVDADVVEHGDAAVRQPATRTGYGDAAGSAYVVVAHSGVFHREVAVGVDAPTIEHGAVVADLALVVLVLVLVLAVPVLARAGVVRRQFRRAALAIGVAGYDLLVVLAVVLAAWVLSPARRTAPRRRNIGRKLRELGCALSPRIGPGEEHTCGDGGRAARLPTPVSGSSAGRGTRDDDGPCHGSESPVT